MPESETLEVIIRGRDQLGNVIGGVNKQLTTTQRVAARTGKAMRRLRGGMGGLRKSIFGLRTAIAGLGLGLLARQFIIASNEQQKAIEGMNASLRAMGRFTPELSKSLQQVATSLQGVTNFGDEATLGGIKFLATYRNISDDLLPRASAAMLDFAALMGGDTVQAANALGKASIGMTGELRRSGIIVEANTFKQEGFLGVLKEIEAQVGGQAAAQRKATGSLVAFGNVVGDTQEFLGDLLKLSLEPLLQVLVESFDDLNAKIQKLKDEGQLHIWAEQWSTVILNVLAKIGKGIGLVADAFFGWKLLWEVLKIAFSFFAQFLNKGLSILTKVYSKFFKFWSAAALKLAETIEKLDITGKFKGVSNALRGVSGFLGKIQGGLEGASKATQENVKFWGEVRAESKETLNNLIAQGKPSTKINAFFDKIIAKAQTYTKKILEMEEAQKDVLKPPPVPEASFEAQTKSLILRARETNATIVAQWQDMFDKGEKSAKEFFDKRKELLEDDFQVQKKALEAQAELAALFDPTKELKLRDQVFKLEEKFTRDSIALAKERLKVEEEVGDKRIEIAEEIAGIERRAQGDPVSMQEQFAQEFSDLIGDQLSEISALRRKGADEETEINRVKNAHILEQENLLADQRKRLLESQVAAARATFTTLEQAFGDLYEGTGKKIKAFFILQKAAGVANTLIATYESAQQVYKSASQIPFIGQFLGPAAAAVAIAAGLARVSLIRSQQLAAGGSVSGTSPTKTADNVPIMATAGEFMHPVDTVRHYGTRAMEAIRKKMIPRELLSGYGISAPKPNYGHAFQTGGQVGQGGVPTGPEGGQKRGVVIANFYDPEELTRFLATSRGQDAVVNAIAGRSETVRRVIS